MHVNDHSDCVLIGDGSLHSVKAVLLAFKRTITRKKSSKKLLVVLLVRSSYTVIDILCLDCIVSCDDEKEIGQKFVDKWIKKGGFDANIKAKILTMSQTNDPVCVDGFSLVYIQKSALQSHGSKANADEKEIIVMDIT
eukprot:586354_1